MENVDLFLRFGAAIAIGFLIGLRREYAHLRKRMSINTPLCQKKRIVPEQAKLSACLFLENMVLFNCISRFES